MIGRGISSNQREIHALSALGYQTLMIGDDSLAQIEESIKTIGQRVGKAQQAAAVIASIEANVNDVRARVQPFPLRRTLMLVGHQPIVAVGPGTFLDDLLKIAGAENIADASAQQWPQLSIEYIVAMRPEVIIDGQMGTDPRSPSRYWDAYPTIPAVTNHRVVGISGGPDAASGSARGRDPRTDRETGSSGSMDDRAMNAAPGAKGAFRIELEAFEGAYLTRSRMLLALTGSHRGADRFDNRRGSIRQRARSA